jgi:hypothetical protein
MQAVIYLVFVAATFADFATTALKAPGLLKFVPEALSCIVAIWVLFEGIRRGFTLPAKYWAVFGMTALVIVCGLITNSVGTGPTLAGMRYYLRPIPLFLLPAVIHLSEEQFERQMRFLLGIGLLQLPVAAYQRWVIYSAGRFSGDDVRGTVMDSGILSIILIGMAVVLTGYFMHKRIPRLRYLVLFFLLLLPTTINETKATVVFVPIGMLTAIVIASPRGRRMKILAGGIALMLAFGAVLVPVYNLMNANSPYKDDKNLLDFFTNQKQMTQYLEGKREVALGTRHDVRRGDAIAIPVKYLAKDPVHLAFGLGMGNVSHSNIGEQFTGAYYSLFSNFVITSLTVFILEIGLLGVSLVLLIYFLIFTDSIAVSRLDTGPMGAFAAGWVGVVVIMTAGTLYAVAHTFAAPSYLFWYGSGLVAARRGQLMFAGQRSPSAAASRATA